MNLFNKQGNQVMSLNTSKQINSGGEGAIYEHPTNKHLVVKIYHTGITPNVTEASVQELNKLSDYFIKPLSILYDSKGKILGYEMEYLNTKDLVLLSSIYNKSNALKFGFTEKIKKDIFYRITQALLAAHKQGVVVGDLNPYNVFVGQKSGQVKFIDVDSFQTNGRKHSGVVLPEVRDWMFNDISVKSDYYALAVMGFQMFTYVHPFKGVHSSIKSLEERVIKHVSVLSGDKNLILPPVYEPFSSGTVKSDFMRIFHSDERFPIDLSGSGVVHITVVQKPTVVQKVAGVTVFVISDKVLEFYATSSSFYIRKEFNEFEIFKADTHSVVRREWSFNSDQILIGKKEFLSIAKGNISNQTSSLRNLKVPYDYSLFQSNGYAIMFDNENDSYSILSIDKMYGATVEFSIGSIYVKSIDIQDALIQTVGNFKYILDISDGYLKTIRTTLNIKNAYVDGDVGCVEVSDKYGIKYYPFKINGLQLEVASTCFSDFRYLTQKGDYIYVPEDGYIDVRRKLDFQSIMHIACPEVTVQSRLKSTDSGILCLTNDTLYLINKNN